MEIREPGAGLGPIFSACSLPPALSGIHSEQPVMSLTGKPCGAFIRDHLETGDENVSSAEYYKAWIQNLDVPGIAKFYRLQLAIWQIRPNDLQRQFDLADVGQRIQYLAWCMIHGSKEYQAMYELDVFWLDLNKKAPIARTIFSDGISQLIRLWAIFSLGPEVQSAMDCAATQKKILQMYWFGGGFSGIRQPLKLMGQWQKDYLINNDSLESTNFAKLLYDYRPDLQSAFDLGSSSGKHAYKKWLCNFGVVETPLKTILSRQKRSSPPPSFAHDGEVPAGVNLIGYAYGQLGIGEDVRMAAHALSEAGVPFTVINFNPGPLISNEDFSIKQWVSEKSIYSVNLICLTAMETLRLYLEKGESLFCGRYNIGYWPWELQEWPTNWLHCLTLVDEVWASSNHIKQALDKVSSRPVRHMPMAVKITPCVAGKEELRSAFRLCQDKTLFVFSFDGGSHIERKNPHAVIRAFNLAFPSMKEDVVLVIKCMRPDPSNSVWRDIMKVAELDARIVVIDKTLSKNEVLSLYAACDCFVSLHRAEGFGRGIAEALILKMRVIATNYGGNVDFCSGTNVKLVPYELVSVEEGQYIECENNYWAEPDIVCAAQAMREVHSEVSLGEKRTVSDIEDFEKLVNRLFSPRNVGKKYLEVLKCIY